MKTKFLYNVLFERYEYFSIIDLLKNRSLKFMTASEINCSLQELVNEKKVSYSFNNKNVKIYKLI